MLITRARGLSSHLVPREALETLANAADLPSLAKELATFDLEPPGEPLDLPALERAIRRTAGRHLRTLQRWRGDLPDALTLFFAMEDRRSLRALIRGALQGAPLEARLAGLLSTPSLPERALTELARQPTPQAVIAHLVLLQHPSARRLAAVATTTDLFAIESALLAAFADQARAIREPTLADFVHASIDLGNAQNALLFSSGARDVEPVFIDGGAALTREAFFSVAKATSRSEALDHLRKGPLSARFPIGADDAANVERAFLADTLAQLARQARREPLGAAPVLRFLLRLEAQSRDLRTLAWGAVLQAPPKLRTHDLVTPWS
jgi:vacuolar-type H+-ATPase subunit C/Vma6